MSSANSSEEAVARIYDKIDLFSLKHSLGLLMGLEREVIEVFVNKYSAIIIFLLNILDQKRSSDLLQKLTDNSIVYVIEEELRFLIIREIAFFTSANESIEEVVSAIEYLDNPVAHASVGPEITAIMNKFLKSQETRKKKHFSYMDALQQGRRKNILRILIERNIYATFCMLSFASDGVVCAVVDEIIRQKKENLRYIIDEILNIRFRKNYQGLLNPVVFQHLPASIQKRFNRLKEIKQRLSREFRDIDAIIKSEESGFTKNQKLMNKIFGTLKKIAPEMHDLVLEEYRENSVISEEELYILKVMLKRFQKGPG